MNATKKLITYLANPYQIPKDKPKKGTSLTKTGKIWKNDYLKFDMTSQRGYK
jgi:hypothetical protein